MHLHAVPTLPRVAPPGIDPDFWYKYTDAVAPEIKRKYSGTYSYDMTGLYFPDGFNSWLKPSFTEKAALTKVILRSLTAWNSDAWRDCTIEKQGGESHSQKIKSPLRHALEILPWICFERDGEYLSFRPQQLILVPGAQLEWGRHRFDHLDYLPLDLVRLVDSQPGTAEVLQQVGMSVYPGESKSPDVRFLESLAAAVASNRFNPSNRDVLLGQLYAGWSALEPADPGGLPMSLVVSRGRVLDTARANGGSTFYLPDEDRGAVELLKREGHPIVEIHVPDARRIKPHFEQSFAGSVRPLSRFSVTPLVGGSKWQPAGDEQILANSEFGWIPAVTLAVAAYAGNSAVGTHARSFMEGVKRLRRTRVAFTGPVSLRADWEGEILFERRVPVVWLSDSETLLIDKTMEGWLEGLAEPLEEILQRGDLASSLQLVLTKLNPTEPPSLEHKLQALQAIRVTSDQFSEVEKVWLGDLSWLLQRLSPAIRLFLPNFEISSLSSIRTETELRTVLEQRWSSEKISIDELISITRSGTSDEEVGRNLFVRVGPAAELCNWNQVLLELGEPYRIVRNDEAQDQFMSHLKAMRTCVNSIFRRLALEKNEAQLFISSRDEFDQIQPPKDIEFRAWQVDFPVVSALVHELLTRHRIEAHQREAVLYARSAADLIKRLENLGLDPKTDPAQLFAANLLLCKKALDTLFRTGLLLAERQGMGADPWTEPIDSKFENLQRHLLSGVAYLEAFSEKIAIVHTLEFIPQDAVGIELRAKMVLAEQIDDIPKMVGLTPEDLTQADDVISRAKEAERRKRRQVEICGAAFDSEDSNLQNLLGHISEKIPAAGLNLDAFANLKKIRVAKPTTGDGTGKRGGDGRWTVERLSKAEQNVIGLAGEIHVWRALKHRFGDDLTAECWVSENRKYIFSDKPGNDSLGYDFELKSGEIFYRIEVKATRRGDRNTFELGPSEVRCAARIGAHRKEQYLIVHVMNALSSEPSLVVLPNPYDLRYADRFRFYESSAFSISYESESGR